MQIYHVPCHKKLLFRYSKKQKAKNLFAYENIKMHHDRAVRPAAASLCLCTSLYRRPAKKKMKTVSSKVGNNPRGIWNYQRKQASSFYSYLRSFFFFSVTLQENGQTLFAMGTGDQVRADCPFSIPHMTQQLTVQYYFVRSTKHQIICGTNKRSIPFRLENGVGIPTFCPCPILVVL